MTLGRRELLAAEEVAWGEYMSLVSSLTPEQLEEPGYSPDGWSVKDLIAHIGAWHAAATQILEQIRCGTYRDPRLDVDRINLEFYEANKDLPLNVVRAECAASRNRFLVEWDALPEASPEAEEWFRESGPEHMAEHLPRLREWTQHLRSR